MNVIRNTKEIIIIIIILTNIKLCKGKLENLIETSKQSITKECLKSALHLQSSVLVF